MYSSARRNRPGSVAMHSIAPSNFNSGNELSDGLSELHGSLLRITQNHLVLTDWRRMLLLLLLRVMIVSVQLFCRCGSWGDAGGPNLVRDD